MNKIFEVFCKKYFYICQHPYNGSGSGSGYKSELGFGIKYGFGCGCGGGDPILYNKEISIMSSESGRIINFNEQDI